MTLTQYFISKEENNFIWIRGVDDADRFKRLSCYIYEHYNETISYYAINNVAYATMIPYKDAKKAMNGADNIESFLIYDPIKKCFNYLYFWQERNRTKQEFISWLEKCSKRAIKCVSMYTI